MKSFFIIILFGIGISLKAAAQDTVKLNNLRTYVGRKVQLIMPVDDFDLRQEYMYLYMGNRYPEQQFTVIIQRNDGNKRIKISKDVILGRAAVSLTGYIAIYDGAPDTTKNYLDAAIKKEFEKDMPIVIGGYLHGTGHQKYIPRTEPISLKGQLVMIITEQKQIGATYPLLPSRSITTPSVFNDTIFDN